LNDEQEGVFTDLRQLVKLDLANNIISSVEPRVFDVSANLTMLVEIDLSHNRMTELEPWPLIRAHHGRTYVYVRNNRITNFTNALRWSFDCNSTRPFYVLNTLYLQNNDVKHITDIIHGWSIDGELL